MLKNENQFFCLVVLRFVLFYNSKMDLKSLINKHFGEFEKKEGIFFLTGVICAVLISIYMKDNPVVTISTFCGIAYTILAGKGRVFCYYIGILGTFCYCYIAYKNGFFGNFLLYGLYFLPMQIIGIFKWKKKLKKDKNEIIKTKLKNKEKFTYYPLTFIVGIIIYFILKSNNSASPIMDSFAVSFSILGQFLTVKRCYEQWIIWFFVNVISTTMWIFALLNGAHCAGTVIMWSFYTVLAIYFLYEWKKELKIA